MPLEECPHCLTKVIFNDTLTCPSCGKKKNYLPGKSRDELFLEKEKKETEDKIKYYKKNGRTLLFSGIILTFGTLVIIIISLFYGPVFILWYGGVIAGIAMIGKGYTQMNTANDLKYFYDKKYNHNLKR